MDWKTALQNMALPARSYGDPAGQIFNCSWICYTSVASPEVLAKKGSRNVYIDVQNGCGRENITVLVGGSAAGEVLPPFIMYKGKMDERCSIKYCVFHVKIWMDRRDQFFRMV
jgi:hypothetical protein